MKIDFEKIAITIGHHFWKCDTDKLAYEMGYDCAKEIERCLNETKDSHELQNEI